MRGYAPAEVAALRELTQPPSYWDARTPEGAFIDSGMCSLLERRCVTVRVYTDGASFTRTELGHIAQRLVKAVSNEP